MSRSSFHAVDPVTGEVTWTHPAPTKDTAHLISSTKDRFGYITGGRIHEYELSSATDTLAIREVWKSRHFRGSNAIPVYRNGYYFGYRGNFLTCIDAKTGDRVWQSRPPGKGALTLLGDVLLVWDITGRLNVIAASPNGYRELGSLTKGDGRRKHLAPRLLRRNGLRQKSLRGSSDFDPSGRQSARFTTHSRPGAARHENCRS